MPQRDKREYLRGLALEHPHLRHRIKAASRGKKELQKEKAFGSWRQKYTRAGKEDIASLGS